MLASLIPVAIGALIGWILRGEFAPDEATPSKEPTPQYRKGARRAKAK